MKSIIKFVLGICNGVRKIDKWMDDNQATLNKVTAVLAAVSIQSCVYMVASEYGWSGILKKVEFGVTIASIIGYNLYIRFWKKVDVEVVE